MKMNVYKFGQSEAASYAIVKFLEIESTQEQSSGWMLLTTINLLASLGLEAFINGMTLASLPSTLVKCFYLFFDLPEVKDPDLLEPGSEFTPRERRVLLQKVFVQVSWFSGWKDRGLRAVDVGNRSTFLGSHPPVQLHFSCRRVGSQGRSDAAIHCHHQQLPPSQYHLAQECGRGPHDALQARADPERGAVHPWFVNGHSDSELHAFDA